MKEAQGFKTCLRTCRTTDPDRVESDAEHSWHLGLFLILLKDRLGEVDFERILELALIHDLPEIYCGDANPYRDDGSHKDRAEAEAAERLFSLLPSKAESRLGRTFKEYQDQETIEARIVKAADKLLPLIQNLCTNESFSSYRELKVTVQEVEKYMGPFFKNNGVLKDLFGKLMDEARENNVFHHQENRAEEGPEPRDRDRIEVR